MAGLCPNRQSLLDWSRYGHLSRKQGFWSDLIWGEKSPPLVAMAINILIPTLIWVTWLIFSVDEVWMSGDMAIPKNMIGMMLILFLAMSTLSMMLIYVTLVQIVILTKRHSSAIWSINAITVLIALPIFMGVLLMINTVQVPLLWMFTPLPILVLYKGSILTCVLGFSLQLGILGLLIAQLKKQIHLTGSSETQTLLNTAS